MLLVTAAQMRELDRATIEDYGTPGYTLMQRAGRGATAMLCETFPHLKRRRVVVCAGKGNNGGDGFVMARELKRAGIAVDVFVLGTAGDVRGDAARALKDYAKVRGKVHECRKPAELSALQGRLDGAAAVVDAIFGTGLKGAVEGLAADAIALLNASGVPIFAVDIPSGLDSDRGVPLGTSVQAEATATFGFAKLGHVLHPGCEYTGRLGVVDIGIAPQAIELHPPRSVFLDGEAVSRLVPRRGMGTHKGDCGHVLILAGSRGKTGAAMLAARAATRTGAGLVTVASPASQQPIVAGGVVEAMTEVLPDCDGQLEFDAVALARLVERKDVVVFGPGIGTGDGAQRTLEWLLAHVEAPIVVDADGLTCAARNLDAVRHAKGDVLLTPHPGEMARLNGSTTVEVQADRPGVAARFAAQQRCTLVLKGARSVIASPDGWLAVNPTGNPGMASGGMGDVLSGVLGALLGQGLSAREAAWLGVYLHGLAADRAAAEQGVIGLVASDVIAHLPSGLREISTVIEDFPSPGGGPPLPTRRRKS